MRTPMRALACTVALAAGLCVPAAGWAGGYDTPMLYSARHMGMGGAAIGYVNDPSALFHNPAGLGHIKRLTLLGDFSLLLARVRSTPVALPQATDIESETTVAPMFLLGGGFRLTDWLVIGGAVYPVASAGATYKYPGITGGTNENETRLVFFEASLAATVNLPYNVRVGAGYRATYVNLERFQGVPGMGAGFDFKLKGFNWAGFRVGAQWTPLPFLDLGLVYRHKTKTKVENDTGRAIADFRDVETTFLLPSKLGAGSRLDLGKLDLAPVAFVLDFEYLWNSQNDAFPLKGVPAMAPAGTPPTEVANIYDWENQYTVRAGVEYRLLPAPQGTFERLALRAGYIYDSKTTNPSYPSPFGTPPGPTQIVTGGLGWNGGPWQVNVAYAYRFGEGDVTPADLARATRPCAFCGAAGNDPYRIRVHGLYVDASWAFD